MDYGKGEFITNRIKVYGIVQGVGFRPLVYHIAKKYGINGYVRNVGGYVEILAQANQGQYQSFLSELVNDHSTGCEIVRYEEEAVGEIICTGTQKTDENIRTRALKTDENIRTRALKTDENIRTRALKTDENICTRALKTGEIICTEAQKIGEICSTSNGHYQEFIIVESECSNEVSILPPDLPVCESCLKELMNSSDRRSLNPFISCTACGPRYTIIEELPYDRNNTSMTDFGMCESCSEEYHSPESRRHHAQTISCNDCGPYLIYQELNKEAETATWETYNREAFSHAVEVLKNGSILAVKGIGGYHFVCSPFIEESVVNLRKLKGREEKPFAVMFETLEVIKEYCNVSEEEEKLLKTKAHPIVLLTMYKEALAPSTNRGSVYCGAFLPYTPLQLLLTKECGPLIMTSANQAGKPIIREDEMICSIKSPYLSGILYNKRRIVRSVDDSVAKVIDHKPQLIRRSRGYVPYPVFIDTNLVNLDQRKYEQHEAIINNEKLHAPSLMLNNEKLQAPSLMLNNEKLQAPSLILNNEKLQAPSLILNNEKLQTDSIVLNNRNLQEVAIFAAGGDLKAAYCLYHKGSAVVSQYFGDIEEEAVLTEYANSYRDLSRLLKITPDIAVCDLHPNYHSTRFVRSLGIPVLHVQHHHAHIASVMAEHGLIGPVLGVAFDGTGYGEDGNIWGGEFLLCEGAGYQRVAKLRYIPMLGGDSSMRDAKKTAACYLIASGLEEYLNEERLPVIKAALEHRVNTVLTSSIGRLFDAVASILDLGQENRYEGECAAALEREAVYAVRNQIEPAQLSFSIEEKDEIIEINPKPLLNELCRLSCSTTMQSLALGFHYAVADMILLTSIKIRSQIGVNDIALSGGVFQNTILTERTCKLLRENGFTVYYNLAVPPNDGGISLGQTYIGLLSR